MLKGDYGGLSDNRSGYRKAIDEMNELIENSKKVRARARQMRYSQKEREEKAREKLHFPSFYEKLKDYGYMFYGGIIGLILSFYFLAPNFTGNVIANLEVGKTNIFGAVLFLFGLLSIFISLRKR